MKYEIITEKYQLHNATVDDFLKICPYSVKELHSRKRPQELTDYRAVYHYLLVKKHHSLIKTARIVDRTDCAVSQSINKILIGYKEIVDILNKFRNKSLP